MHGMLAMADDAEARIDEAVRIFIATLWDIFKQVQAQGGEIVVDEEADVNDAPPPAVSLTGGGLWIAVRYANGMIYITRPDGLASALKAARTAPVAQYGPFEANSLAKARELALAKFGEVVGNSNTNA